MSKKHKIICTALNYTEQFLVLTSVVTRYISISAFTSLLDFPIGIANSAVGLEICAIHVGIEKYKSITKKKKKKHDKILLLARS